MLKRVKFLSLRDNEAKVWSVSTSSILSDEELTLEASASLNLPGGSPSMTLMNLFYAKF